MKRQLIWALFAGLLAWLGWLTIKHIRGTAGVGAPKLKAKTGVKYVDPCPGDGQIWDAETSRCIPLVEEPVGLSGKQSWN